MIVILVTIIVVLQPAQHLKTSSYSAGSYEQTIRSWLNQPCDLLSNNPASAPNVLGTSTQSSPSPTPSDPNLIYNLKVKSECSKEAQARMEACYQRGVLMCGILSGGTGAKCLKKLIVGAMPWIETRLTTSGLCCTT